MNPYLLFVFVRSAHKRKSSAVESPGGRTFNRQTFGSLSDSHESDVFIQFPDLAQIPDCVGSPGVGFYFQAQRFQLPRFHSKYFCLDRGAGKRIALSIAYSERAGYWFLSRLLLLFSLIVIHSGPSA